MSWTCGGVLCFFFLAAAAAACKADDPVAPPIPAAAPASPAALDSPDPAARAAAAAALQRAPRTPTAESVWTAKLAALPRGIARDRFVEAIPGAICEQGVGGMGGSSVTVRLDDDWVVTVNLDPKGLVTTVGPVTHRLRAITVAAPPSFTGEWLEYFVDGSVCRRSAMESGQLTHFSTYYDNGRLLYETEYKDGLPDGSELGFHPDGTRMYVIHYAAGKRVGVWNHWYPTGKKATEETFVDDKLEGPSLAYREDGTRSARIDYHAGKETGQAAWDENGIVLYARGTAENP